MSPKSISSTDSITTTRPSIWLRLVTSFIAALFVTALMGCDSKPQIEVSDDEATIRLPAPMEMLVVGNEEFGEEAARQWAARRDGQIKVSHLAMDDFIAGQLQIKEEIDIVVYPSRLLGELAIRESVRPVPKNIWENPTFNKEGLLRHYRKTLVRHDNKVWGLPLGGQQLVLLYRKDVLSKLGYKLPATWQELNEILVKLKESSDESITKFETPLLAPLEGGWAGELLLARVAASIRQQGKLSTVFNRRNVKPLIEQEPFVLALNELKSMVGSAESQNLKTPQAVYEAFANGKSVFAITWPAKSNTGDSNAEQSVETESENWGVVSLPGSGQVFDIADQTWRNRPKGSRLQVDSLGFNGWVASVPAGTRNYRDAFEFASWMSEKQMSQTLLTSLSGPFRASHLGALDRWIDDALDRSFVDDYADVIRNTHEESIVLVFPRVAARTRYMATLDNAVVEFLTGDKKAEKILSDVAAEWEAITETEGRTKQSEQIRRSADL